MEEQKRSQFAVLLAVRSKSCLFTDLNKESRNSWIMKCRHNAIFRNINIVMYERTRISTGSVLLMTSKCLLFTFCDLEKHLNIVQKTSVNKGPQTHVQKCIQAGKMSTIRIKYEIKTQISQKLHKLIKQSCYGSVM